MSRGATRRSQPPLFFTPFTNIAFFFVSLSLYKSAPLSKTMGHMSVISPLHPTMVSSHTLKFALLLSSSLIILNFCSVPVHALNVGIQATDISVSVGKDCSRKCESAFCQVPPFLRYGKYCGLLYSGCPGEKPCDGLDACCMKHDACVQVKNNGYLSQECSQNLLDCMTNFENSGAHTFKGSSCQADEVIDVISAVMEAALLAGRYLHKP